MVVFSLFDVCGAGSAYQKRIPRRRVWPEMPSPSTRPRSARAAERRRAAVAREQLFGMALHRRVEARGEPFDGAAAGPGSHGDSVAEREPAVRDGRSRHFIRNAMEIGGIRGSDDDPVVRLGLATQPPQLLDGLDQRKLLAAERLDEAAAADLAARLGR